MKTLYRPRFFRIQIVKRMTWDGITMDVSYNPFWKLFQKEVHLQIVAVSPERAVLPLGGMDYVMAIVNPHWVAECGGIVGWVRNWMDQFASEDWWIEYKKTGIVRRP